MNETRYDWLANRWVIFAPNREERPDEFKLAQRQLPSSQVDCPFCSGAEHETPSPTLVLPILDTDSTTANRRTESGKSSGKPWLVRVVPNKFPAVERSKSNKGPLLRSTPLEDVLGNIGYEPSGNGRAPVAVQTTQASQLFQRAAPSGAHEVIIEAPMHVDSITALPVEHVAHIFDAYRRRLNHWRAQRDLKYAVIFKNYGPDAGASLYHSHSQLISLDFVPSDIERMNQRLMLYYESYGNCYICQMLAEEEERDERILLSTEHFVAVCPFASRFPYAFSILPRQHRSRFEEISEDELQELAKVAKRSLAALETAHPSAAYNFVLLTSSFQDCHEESYHWRLRVIPRLSKVAGFEWGSECFINTVTPEFAARTLREHLKD